MLRLIFVDTSAWVAAFVERDGSHGAAVQEMERILDEGATLLTTDYVLDESVTRIRYEGGHELAVDVGEQLQTSRLARLVEVGREGRDEALGIFKKCKDQKFSFTDCTSFATMKRFGLSEAFTFDRDFEKMGFLVVPRKGGRRK